MPFGINVNFFAVLVAAIIAQALGAFWYSPKLFGRSWLKAVGLSETQAKKAHKDGMGTKMLTAFIAWLITFYILALFVSLTSASTFVLGAQVGFWAWLGFIATTSIGVILWELKPVKLWIINNVYNLIVLAIGGGLLAVWP